jgi:4-aminobutyrate aminotransferase / (S)-3-amino-2-methylpropionate transaminase / 5-aminovalerate transaminase
MIRLRTPIPGPESRRLMDERRKHVARGPFHTTPIFAKSAKGSYIEDVDGNQILDFASGIGVTNCGHAPASVVQAIETQLKQFLHTSYNVVAYEGYGLVAEKLNAAVPGAWEKKTFLANSGAEAVENAIKIARAHTKRQAVVCFEHAYHGRTYMAMAATAKVKPYKLGFGPFPSEVYRAPFPYPYRWPTTSSPDLVAEECFAAFTRFVDAEVGATSVACVIVEPVLGEGGFIPCPPAFFQKLREYCTQTGIVLIADEVQTGFGRTGTMFACEQLGAAPDLLVSAKGIAAGLPLSAVTGRADIMDAPSEGGIGGTYCGNPVSCASALAVFELFADGKLLANARKIGQALEARMAKWGDLNSAVGEVRGLGPMRAVELVKDRKTKEPNPALAKDLIRYGYERGLVLMNAGTYGNVLRLLVPLCATPEELNEGLSLIEQGLRDLR